MRLFRPVSQADKKADSLVYRAVIRLEPTHAKDPLGWRPMLDDRKEIHQTRPDQAEQNDSYLRRFFASFGWFLRSSEMGGKGHIATGFSGRRLKLR